MDDFESEEMPVGGGANKQRSLGAFEAIEYCRKEILDLVRDADGDNDFCLTRPVSKYFTFH